jgi:hypothetical protein
VRGSSKKALTLFRLAREVTLVVYACEECVAAGRVLFRFEKTGDLQLLLRDEHRHVLHEDIRTGRSTESDGSPIDVHRRHLWIESVLYQYPQVLLSETWPSR